VRQDVPHAANLAPVHLGSLGDDVVGQVLGGFADDLDVPDHRVPRALVGDERLVAHPRDEAPDLGAGLDDVVGVEPPVPGARSPSA
jgi:hypothetical protein